MSTIEYLGNRFVKLFSFLPPLLAMIDSFVCWCIDGTAIVTAVVAVCGVVVVAAIVTVGVACACVRIKRFK